MSSLAPLFVSMSIFVFALLPAGADVSGFEHLRDIAIDCGKAPVEEIKPRSIKNHFLCTYEHRLCKVLNKKELQFEAYISVDCEVKSATAACPSIEACAKPNQLSAPIAEEVRHMNDPNFTGAPDGAVMPRAPSEGGK